MRFPMPPFSLFGGFSRHLLYRTGGVVLRGFDLQERNLLSVFSLIWLSSRTCRIGSSDRRVLGINPVRGNLRGVWGGLGCKGAYGERMLGESWCWCEVRGWGREVKKYQKRASLHTFPFLFSPPASLSPTSPKSMGKGELVTLGKGKKGPFLG